MGVIKDAMEKIETISQREHRSENAQCIRVLFPTFNVKYIDSSGSRHDVSGIEIGQHSVHWLKKEIGEQNNISSFAYNDDNYEFITSFTGDQRAFVLDLLLNINVFYGRHTICNSVVDRDGATVDIRTCFLFSDDISHTMNFGEVIGLRFEAGMKRMLVEHLYTTRGDKTVFSDILNMFDVNGAYRKKRIKLCFHVGDIHIKPFHSMRSPPGIYHSRTTGFEFDNCNGTYLYTLFHDHGLFDESELRRINEKENENEKEGEITTIITRVLLDAISRSSFRSTYTQHDNDYQFDFKSAWQLVGPMRGDGSECTRYVEL